MGLAPGTRLGVYEVSAPIGEGGMGQVYRARDTTLNRDVALKILPDVFASDPDRLARLTREARTLASLNHPNIAAIYGFEESQDARALVMELVKGEPLSARIRRGPILLTEALPIAKQVADALEAAHEQGIVHRDVKPDNVMIRPDGFVKVLDFGLAKLMTARAGSADADPTRTQPGLVMGTPRYMSPEQARGFELDARTDVWSLGVVLYEMVTGRPPFDGATPTDVLAAILRAEPVPLDLRALQAPQAFGRIVGRMLAKNVVDRFTSARELHLELAALVSELDSGAGRAVAMRAVPAVTPDLLDIGSIAVLPFANTSGDPDSEYLSEGITESLINRLSALPGLRVVPRSTALRYKGADGDLERVVRELNVRVLLTGSIRQRQDTLTVQVELVDAVANCQIWGHKSTRRFADIAALEEDIAHDIVKALRIKLNGVEQERLGRRSTQDREAYHLYLKGRHLWNKRTRDALEQAIQYFKQAIDKDSVYALAYAGLADCYVVLGSFGFRAPDETFPRARSAAFHAISIDEALAEPHVSLAVVRSFYEADWEGAERESQRAIAIDPSYAVARQWYGAQLCFVGEFTQGLEQLQEARRLEPLSPMINTQLGVGLYLARRYDEAAQVLLNTIEFEPAFWPSRCFLGMVRSQQRDESRAIGESETAVQLSGRHPMALAGLGHILGRFGNREQPARLLAEFHTRARSEYIAPDHFALIHAAQGDDDLALERLRESVASHSPYAAWLKADPRFDSLRADARFDVLVRDVFGKRGSAARLLEEE